MAELPRYLQLLWDREPEGRRGPKPGRTIHEIGAAAVAIADDQGLDAVSMKGVAAAVGFTTMSLYRYLDGKDELYAVMGDVAMGPPPVIDPVTDSVIDPTLDPGAGSGWRDRLGGWTRAVTAVRLAHPWLVDLPQEAPPLTPNLLAWTDAGLAALEGTGLGGQQRFSTLLAVDGWAANHVRQTLRMGLIGELDPDGPQAAYLQHIGSLIDPVRLPHLARQGSEALGEDDGRYFEEEFDFGLGLLLDGLQALMDRGAASS